MHHSYILWRKGKALQLRKMAAALQFALRPALKALHEQAGSQGRSVDVEFANPHLEASGNPIIVGQKTRGRPAVMERGSVKRVVEFSAQQARFTLL